ncbi:MAG: DUF1028 domain-containing protein [Anaerolineae bacterium]|nr:DUF1028 domain-containing protein [Anaerolineae bacterium]
MAYQPDLLFSTYSIVARDPGTGQFGVAVQTHQMCVGRVVPWMRPGVGALATQASTNVSFGPVGLALLAEDVSAPRVIEALVASDPEAHRRQVAVVDRQGQAAAWTGPGCIPEAAHQIGAGYSVQANMMDRPTVVPAMAEAYERAEGDLAERMLAALMAAQDQGGDIRGMQSAALKVVPGELSKPSWASDYDLRVDEHAQPVIELARLVRLRRAQHIDRAGQTALSAGQREEALTRFSQARALAPELEELAFWQAVALADGGDDLATALAILEPALAADERRAHWIELLRRLEVCGFIGRPGVCARLAAALRSAKDLTQDQDR